jgi:hypothetical protein
MVGSIAEGIMMPDNKRLKALAGAHFTIGLVIGILALVRVPIPLRLHEMLIVSLIASLLSQAFLLALWGVTCTASLWKRIAGLVAGTVYLETLLVLVDSTLLDVATITIAFTTATLLVLRTNGVRLVRHDSVDPFARADTGPLRFSIRSLMLLTAAVALLGAVARALHAIPYPEKIPLINILFSLSFVATGFVALWAALMKTRSFGRGSIAFVLSPILGLFFAIASSADQAGWVFIFPTLILGSAAMLGSFLVVRSCGFRFVSIHSSIPEHLSDDEHAGRATCIGKSAG